MIDQRMTELNRFFGIPASTTTIHNSNYKKFKCDLVPIYIEE